MLALALPGLTQMLARLQSGDRRVTRSRHCRVSSAPQSPADLPRVHISHGKTDLRYGSGGQDVRILRAVTKVAKEVQDKISALRLALARRLGKQRFELWFGSESALTIVNGTVRIGLPNLLFQKWVAQQFRDDILAACSEVLGFAPQLEFTSAEPAETPSFDEIDQHRNGHSPETGNASSILPAPITGTVSLPVEGHGEVCESHDDPQRVPLAERVKLSIFPAVGEASSEEGAQATRVSLATETQPDGNLITCSSSASPGDSSSGGIQVDECTAASSGFLFPQPAQLSPAKRSGRRNRSAACRAHKSNAASSGETGPESWNARRRVLTLSDFVVGPCNQLAYAAAVEVTRRPGEISPLFLFGPTSVGKTHLLQAVCEEIRRRHRGLIAVCVSADDFITDSVEALRHGGLPSFRHKFRHVDVLAIDDIQLLVGKKWVQRELLLTIDALLRDGKQLVLASDRPADGLADFGPEFVARLKSGMTCSLDWPDEPTRRGIIEHLCQRLGIALSPEVKEFVAAQLPGHARELLGALRRLQAASLTLAEPLTVTTAAEVLKDLLCQRRRPIRLGDVCQAVCQVFGVEAGDIVGPGRRRSVVEPRLLAMWLARKYTRAGLSEISRFFGRKSHSAVLAAHRTVEKWLAEARPISLGDREVPAAEVVQQIERRLLAG